jgi:hypothetical protein
VTSRRSFCEPSTRPWWRWRCRGSGRCGRRHWLPARQLIEAKRARLLAYLTGTDATATVLRLRKTRTVQAVVIDPPSPGATLIKPLTDAEVAVTQPSTSDIAVAHGTASVA